MQETEPGALRHGRGSDGARPADAIEITGPERDVAGIFEEHEARVRRYIAFRVRDSHDVDDLTADVFRRLVAGPVPVPPVAWGPWLLRVAHNVVVDHYRRRRRFDPLATLLDRPDDAPSLDERLIRDEETRRVDEALARLPGRQRAAVYLRYHEGLDYAHVADVLGVPAVTARTLVHRGLRRVAACLEREG